MGIDECILSKPTDEQKNKTEAAQAPEELLAITKEMGYELSKGTAGSNIRRHP